MEIFWIYSDSKWARSFCYTGFTGSWSDGSKPAPSKVALTAHGFQSVISTYDPNPGWFGLSVKIAVIAIRTSFNWTLPISPIPLTRRPDHHQIPQKQAEPCFYALTYYNILNSTYIEFHLWCLYVQFLLNFSFFTPHRSDDSKIPELRCSDQVHTDLYVPLSGSLRFLDFRLRTVPNCMGWNRPVTLPFEERSMM